MAEMVHVPELLAPAGGPDALRAAISAGADAVYLGLGELSARAANDGFSLGELRRGCALAHAHGARVYVTLNALVRDGELDAAVGLARDAREAGADALIVADAGLCRRLRDAVPEAELHLSTQAGVQAAAAAMLARRELGVSRVTCARELSLGELAALCRAGVPIEAFCHGAICICYSGACQFSALTSPAYSPSNRRSRTSVRVAPLSGQSARAGEGGGEYERRSANRGDCTQPCRIAHTLVDGESRVLAGGADDPVGDRLLCPHDYCSIRHIAELAATGVASLKVEGRMKNPDYVFNVVRCYREALDAVAAGHPLEGAALDGLETRLARSFNRGLTDAYLLGLSGACLMSRERSINQGLCVGRVVERRYREVVVALGGAVGEGDTLEIRSTPGPDAAPDVPKRWPMVPCPVEAAPGEHITVPCKRRVEVGSAVHVVRSARVLAETSSAVAAMAAEERRLECLSEVCPGPSPTKAAIRLEKSDIDPLFLSQGAVFVTEDPREAALALDEAAGAGAYVPAYALLEDEMAWESLMPRLTVILDEVDRAADAPRVRSLCSRAVAVVCRNLGQVDAARGAGIPWETAAPINVWNAETARWLHDMGARRVWLPDELSDEDAACIVRELGGTVPLGRRLTETPQLMVTEHCLLTAEGPCEGEGDPSVCAACPRRAASLRGDRFLRETDGVPLPVRVDALGRTRIFASVPASPALHC